ncbi:MAG: hypothetical protein P1U53_14755, partial [Sulfitobacter sp.]|nr:hypothetical protein [Sulfitobacter sp.]
QQAALFGQAALCHLAAGRAEEHLHAALEALPEGPIMELPICLIQAEESTLAGKEAGPLAPDLPDALILSYAEAQACLTTFDVRKRQLTTEPALPSPGKMPPRISLSDALADRMHRLAARLLVPESDASRLAGAGAGLTDND